jgi:hypothetical protein
MICAFEHKFHYLFSANLISDLDHLETLVSTTKWEFISTQGCNVQVTLCYNQDAYAGHDDWQEEEEEREETEREWEQARNARGMKLEKVSSVLFFLLLLEVVNGMMVCCIQVWLVFVSWVITRWLSSSRYWTRLGLFRWRFVRDPARR